ncbi:PspC domain-containing protein [Rhodococcus zopfii]|uniref:PspC domain-containing protein n=1 Tax=Rhodococcus zopfii TaxID=43772 RepID=UPI003526D48E
MNSRSFHEQLSDMWRTRPVRLPDQGHVAGVCAGIGVRYGVDPVLIRVAFVVSTIFGGAGIVLYLACWVLLARYGDPVSPVESLVGRGHSADSNTKVIVLLVALAVAASALGPMGSGLGGSGFLSMLLMLGGLWLLYLRKPEPPVLPAAPGSVSFQQNPFPDFSFPQAPYAPTQFTQSPFVQEPYAAGATVPAGPAATDPNFWVKNDATGTAPGEPAAPADAVPADGSPPLASSPTDAARPASDPFGATATPPSWDPLGVAPFAWDLPEPAPARTPALEQKQPRSRLTTTILGLAVLAAAAAAAVAAATGVEWLTPARIGAIALAVIGLGLLLGAFLHRGHGLLVVTGPLIGFVVLASLVGPIDTSRWGQQQHAPRTTGELRSEYAVQMGELQLDLRGLTLTENRTVAVENRFGNAQILLPQNLDVEITCTERASSPCAAQGFDGGADGRGGPVLTLDIDTAFGNSEVHRG